MAAVIGDLVSEVSRLRDLIVKPSSLQHPRQPPSRYRACDAPSAFRSPTPSRTHHNHRRLDADKADPGAQDGKQATPLSASSSSCRAPELAVSRFPSSPRPPAPDAATADDRDDDDDDEKRAAALMAPMTQAAACPLVFAQAGSMSYQQQQPPQQPSPPTDDFRIPASPSASTAAAQKQAVVRVRDLAHVQALAATRALGTNGSPHTKYEISAMPMADVIEMVSALLTKITTTNDLQHDATQRNAAHQQQASQNSDATGASSMSPLSHSVLAFHGKNVPAISILSYLSRIHKYCPTTYEVFLSLLVYFDRMTERVNDLIIRTHQSESPQGAAMAQGKPLTGLESHETDWDLSDDDHMVDTPTPGPSADDVIDATPALTPRVSRSVTYFVVDSFNIHRLIIAGVTCASKFFSDVFYTNSRYAKVGGLPLAELNHLEIQFLVLNDFRLVVPVEDLEAYATMLVEFYAREVLTQKATGPGPEA